MLSASWAADSLLETNVGAIEMAISRTGRRHAFSSGPNRRATWLRRLPHAPGLVRGVIVALVFAAPESVEPLHAEDSPIPANASSQSDGRLLGYLRLREGTRVPATVGTVVALGPRRWVFVPAARPVMKPAEPSIESNSVEITVTQEGGTVTKRVDSVTLSTNLPAAPPNALDAGLQPAADASAGVGKGEHLVLITENLMLQRIVQAIKEDELDSSWQITGRVTEYFGENRLTILTAQRAQASQIPATPIGR